ncbi:AbrB family transcriptional regulator [Sulfitobacter aestuarii]|uniref:AbrB family transcriptional regulator n=1 Tax=Sulfitobacter aestuarii TaxID=2161676 RepID=A0ABW5U7F0_9RHOB
MTLRLFVITPLMLAIGTAAGWLAHLTPVPLPYLLGSLMMTGVIATSLPNALPDGYSFPQRVRTVFIAIIGLTIGGRVTSELIGDLNEMVYSLIAVSFFVLLAHMVNYQIFRRLGEMDRITAFFAAAPGGLIESVALSETAGADTKHIVMQQFLRIILVIALVPIAMSLWVGHPVGSAGEMDTVSEDSLTATGIVLLLSTSIVGMLIARILRLPAWELTGPLVAAAALNFVGVGAPPVPFWLLNISQIAIGVSLAGC